MLATLLTLLGNANAEQKLGENLGLLILSAIAIYIGVRALKGGNQAGKS